MSLKKVYLTVYNVVQFAICTIVIVKVLNFNRINNGLNPDSFPIAGTYTIESPLIRIILVLQWMEILHSLFGLTKGSPIASIAQVGLKSLVFFAFCDTEPQVQNDKLTALLPFIWCLGDAARYPFYVLNLFGESNALITWIRYSAWILLYPIGIGLEAVVTYKNIELFPKSGRLSYHMPNKMNYSFDMPSFIYFYLSILPIGTYTMLSYMASQRSKVLSGQSKDTRKQL